VKSKVPLIILCLFFPFIAVLIHDGPSKKVVWAIVLQLLGHIPAVIYGISQVLNDLACYLRSACVGMSGLLTSRPEGQRHDS
jgi:uncharacterized membrane protein YqaE (UPF0057 family)